MLLFFLLPLGISSLIFGGLADVAGVWKSLTEGLIRLIIFIGYIMLCASIKDVKRTFMYHGAEHKTIACYEKGLPLTVENVKPQRRFHPRCGTSFLFLVLLISILVYSVFPITNAFFITAFGVNDTIAMILRVASKIILLPVIVGISYEIIRLAGRYDNILTRIISTPGLALQRLTTKEPDDSQIEIAIAAMERVIPENKEKDKW